LALDEKGEAKCFAFFTFLGRAFGESVPWKVSMPTSFDTIESELLNALSRDHLWETNRHIAQWVRLSGSRDERAAFEYVQGRLDAYGLRTAWLEHPALVSYPLKADLQVIDASGRALARYTCLSHAFSASVENLEAEVVDLGFGKPTDYAANDVRGKVALIDGLATPTAVYAAERAGSVGQIFVNDDHLHNMIVSTVWGTPTTQSAERLPRTPAVSIVAADGRALRAQIAAGATRVRIATRVFTGWQSTPIVIGDLPGRASDDWVMFSGHLDSWDYGAMDNGSANATMLEVARVLAQRKEELYRGLRVIFWSGHSHGRYAGSTWYADHFWEELYDHCVAHVNVDSTGARGATYYGSFQTHMELAGLGAQVIEQEIGLKSQPYRMTRAGDMSFNGIGIPALFMELSQVPADATDAEAALSFGEPTGGKMPWWWHTSEDTFDKVDLEVLERDTRIYLRAVWRLCGAARLPMDFRPVVQDIETQLADLQRAAGDRLDLRPVLQRVSMLAERVNDLARRAASADAPAEISELNRKMKTLSRLLIPITYSAASRFDHDPAWSLPFLPGLQAARELPQLDPASDRHRFLQTELVRHRNALAFALRQAIEALTVGGRQ
jgi:N-acetylated-alpha-linked acidic dipeptidase